MLRKKKSKNRKNNLQEEVVQGYLRGLNHMIAGQPNQAIAEFSKTASISSTLPELYLKLGDLFREKGDIERAIRLHQGVTVRSGVSPEIKIQALNGLARDYRSGGFIDRAVATFEEVLKQDRDHKQALRSLGTIYLEECEWESAYKTFGRLQKLSGSRKYNRILANIRIETGREFLNKDDDKNALKCFNQALKHNPGSTRASILLGDFWLKQRQPGKALEIWSAQLDRNLPFARLIYPRMEKGLKAAGRESEVESFYLDQIERHHSFKHPRYFLAGYYYRNNKTDRALKLLDDILQNDPCFIPAQQLVLQIIENKCRDNDLLVECVDLLLRPEEEQELFVCSKCGYASSDFPWRCPQCQSWDTFVEDHP